MTQTYPMGASFEYETYAENMNREEVKRAFNSDVEECLHMHGHSYSGGIGMLGHIETWLSTTFSDVNAAVDYICDNQKKWDGAMAAQCSDGTWVVGGWCSE